MEKELISPAKLREEFDAIVDELMGDPYYEGSSREEVAADFETNEETGFYMKVEKILGLEREKEIRRAMMKEEQEERERQLTIENILKQERAHLSFGNATWDVSYMGVWLYTRPDGRYDMSVATKHDEHGRGYNPFVIREYKKVKKDKAEEILLEACRKEFSYGSPIVPLRKMIECLAVDEEGSTKT